MTNRSAEEVFEVMGTQADSPRFLMSRRERRFMEDPIRRSSSDPSPSGRRPDCPDDERQRDDQARHTVPAGSGSLAREVHAAPAIRLRTPATHTWLQDRASGEQR